MATPQDIDKLKLAVTASTNVAEGFIKIFQKPFSLPKLIDNLLKFVFEFQLYRSVVESGVEVLAEIRDLDVAESYELAEHFKKEFDIENDVTEAQVEKIVLEMPKLYERIDAIIPVVLAIVKPGQSVGDLSRAVGDAAKEVAYLFAYAYEFIGTVGKTIQLKK